MKMERLIDVRGSSERLIVRSTPSRVCPDRDDWEARALDVSTGQIFAVFGCTWYMQKVRDGGKWAIFRPVSKWHYRSLS